MVGWVEYELANSCAAIFMTRVQTSKNPVCGNISQFSNVLFLLLQHRNNCQFKSGQSTSEYAMVFANGGYVNLGMKSPGMSIMIK